LRVDARARGGEGVAPPPRRPRAPPGLPSVGNKSIPLCRSEEGNRAPRDGANEGSRAPLRCRGGIPRPATVPRRVTVPRYGAEEGYRAATVPPEDKKLWRRARG